MYSKKAITPFSAQLKPSRWLQRFNVTSHLLALVACFLSYLPFYLQLTLMFLIAGDFWYHWRRLCNETREIYHSEAFGWHVVEKGGHQSLRLLASTVVTPWLIFLHSQEYPPILIAKDMLADAEYRRLIVKLKISFDQYE